MNDRRSGHKAWVTKFGLQSACRQAATDRGTLHALTTWEVCMAVYVVTGGGGFIGSHIVEELLHRNETVRIIDNFSTGKRENVEAFKNKVEIIEADIADARNLPQFLKGA